MYLDQRFPFLTGKFEAVKKSEGEIIGGCFHSLQENLKLQADMASQIISPGFPFLTGKFEADICYKPRRGMPGFHSLQENLKLDPITRKKP